MAKLVLLLAFAMLAFVIYLATGSVQFSLGDVINSLLHPGKSQIDTIIWTIRLPRACTCLVVGAMIGIVGSAFQALFRNPLAEPYIIGVSSGASIGAALALLVGFGNTWLGIAYHVGPMLAGLPFGLASLMLVFALARRRGVIEVQTLLLAGVVVGAMLSALLSFILYAYGEYSTRILLFLFGHTDEAFWNQIAIMAIALIIALIIFFVNSKQMNALTLGEQTAQRLGVNVARLKPAILITGSFLVSLTVGAVGIIGFLGLVAPHLARRVVGIDWRWSLLASGLCGSTVLLIADELAQRLPGHDLPVGIVTAMIGAPFLLVLLKARG